MFNPQQDPSLATRDRLYAVFSKAFVAIGLLLLSVPYAWNWRWPDTHTKAIIKGKMYAPTEPEQTLLPANAKLPDFSKRYGRWWLTALASYKITTVVLSLEPYFWDDLSDLSPIDAVVAWGALSDPANFEYFKAISGPRYGTFSYRGTLPAAAYAAISGNNWSNMHLIPANSEITRHLRGLRPLHVVQLNGYLVRADTPGGRWAQSSLRRDDRGGKDGFGSCEIMYVTSVLDPP